jgi:hypothetical protein
VDKVTTNMYVIVRGADSSTPAVTRFPFHRQGCESLESLISCGLCLIVADSDSLPPPSVRRWWGTRYEGVRVQKHFLFFLIPTTYGFCDKPFAPHHARHSGETYTTSLALEGSGFFDTFCSESSFCLLYTAHVYNDV